MLYLEKIPNITPSGVQVLGWADSQDAPLSIVLGVDGDLTAERPLPQQLEGPLKGEAQVLPLSSANSGWREKPGLGPVSG